MLHDAADGAGFIIHFVPDVVGAVLLPALRGDTRLRRRRWRRLSPTTPFSLGRPDAATATQLIGTTDRVYWALWRSCGGRWASAFGSAENRWPGSLGQRLQRRRRIFGSSGTPWDTCGRETDC